jgi:hypothetical protein
MKKPSWLQPLDLIPLLIPVIAAAYAFIHGYEAVHHTQAGVMLVAVPVLMWLLWGRVMYYRKKFLDSCTWFPQYKFMVAPDPNLPTNEQYLLPSEQEFDAAVASTVRDWVPFHPAADRLMKSGVKWLTFRRNLNEVPLTPKVGLVKGLTTGWGTEIFVDFDSRLETLERTAFEHELGHVIHGLATGGWDQEEHHAFAKKNHLR